MNTIKQTDSPVQMKNPVRVRPFSPSGAQSDRFSPTTGSADELDAVIDSWLRHAPRCSQGVYDEIAYASVLGHRPGDPPPLAAGEFVPALRPSQPAFPSEPRPGRLPQHTIEQAKAACISDVAVALGFGELIHRGRDEWGALCPLHDDHVPSLCLNARRGLWYCHACSEGGDVIDLVRRLRGCGFRDAVAWLIELAAPPPNPEAGWEKGEGAGHPSRQTTNRWKGGEVRDVCSDS